MVCRITFVIFTREKTLRFNLFWKIEAILFSGIPMTPNSGHFLLPLLSFQLPSVQWQWQKITQHSCLWILTISLLRWEILRKSVDASWMEKWVSWLQPFVGHWHSSLLSHPSWLRFSRFQLKLLFPRCRLLLLVLQLNTHSTRQKSNFPQVSASYLFEHFLSNSTLQT